jgi:hypothetical protein
MQAKHPVYLTTLQGCFGQIYLPKMGINNKAPQFAGL